MKARVKATGEVWEFSQMDEITFKSAINGHLYCAEELEFLEPSVFTPDYWERLKHQYAGMAMQGLISCRDTLLQLGNAKDMSVEEATASVAYNIATALVEELKSESK